MGINPFLSGIIPYMNRKSVHPLEQIDFLLDFFLRISSIASQDSNLTGLNEGWMETQLTCGPHPLSGPVCVSVSLTEKPTADDHNGSVVLCNGVNSPSPISTSVYESYLHKPLMVALKQFASPLLRGKKACFCYLKRRLDVVCV